MSLSDTFFHDVNEYLSKEHSEAIIVPVVAPEAVLSARFPLWREILLSLFSEIGVTYTELMAVCWNGVVEKFPTVIRGTRTGLGLLVCHKGCSPTSGSGE